MMTNREGIQAVRRIRLQPRSHISSNVDGYDGYEQHDDLQGQFPGSAARDDVSLQLDGER